MTYAHRLWLMIARRTRHSVSLFLLVFCLSLLGIISSYFGNIVACYQRFVVSDIGYSLKLYRTDGNAIPPNVIQQISHIKGVIGCNQEANMLVQPVNFANAIPDSEDNLRYPLLTESQVAQQGANPPLHPLQTGTHRRYFRPR